MKKLINIAGIYFILAMVGGVFYREFTKFMQFSGTTALSAVHVHLMVLGTFLFLILALFAKHSDLIKSRRFIIFSRIYHIAFPLMVIMLTVRGIFQVMETSLSPAVNASISGIAGISHIFIAVAFVYLFLSLKETADE